MTTDEVLTGLGLVEAVAPLLAGDVGRYTAVAMKLAQDYVRAGKSPDDMEELRASIRNDWQQEINARFPNG